jgi:hypothetical protein
MKLKRVTKKILKVSLIFMFLIVSIVVFYFLFIRKDYNDIWYSESWSYRKAIYLKVSTDVYNVEQDVLIDVDTQKLISEGKLEKNCNDLRFIDQDNSMTLRYWIEGGCNTPHTQIWVRTLIPRSSEKIIYMYYGNELAPEGQEPWDGKFISLSLGKCLEDWSIIKDFEGRFPLGSESFGQTGGESTHSHQILFNQSENCTNQVKIATEEPNECDSSKENILNSHSTKYSNLPNFKEVNFCSNRNGYLTNQSIILLDKKTPDQWKHIVELDNRFPIGIREEEIVTNDVLANHKHKLSCSNFALSVDSGSIRYLKLNKNSTSTEVNYEPPYYTINFVSNNNGGTIPSGSILIVTKLPPLGWERYSPLDNKFVKGSNNNYQSTGGAEFHNHSVLVDYSIAYSSIEKISKVRTKEVCIDNTTNLELVESSIMPPYITVIYAKKKESGISTTNSGTNYTSESNISQPNTSTVSTNKETKISFDEEETKDEVQNENGDILGAATPTTPTAPLTEGLTDPINITDPTPEFSAIYNDPDSTDTTSYYEIEVNTTSDFTGLVMWDSGKKSMATTNQGSRSPDISYAGEILQESTTYYWRIRFWDSDDNVSPWSLTSNFALDSIASASSLLTCGFTNPPFVTNNVTFSAIYTDPGNSNATSYEIEVNTASDFTGTVMWDSGKTSTSIASENRSPDYVYSGTTLTHDSTTYYVRLRFWDGDDIATDWVTGHFVDVLKGFKIDGLKLDGLKLD